MEKIRDFFSSFSSGIAAAGLCISVPVLAPLPLLLCRRRFGRVSFFLSVISIGILLFFINKTAFLLFASSGMLAFVFAESESQGLSYSSSALVTVLMVSGFWAIVLGALMRFYGFNPIAFFTEQINWAISQLSQSAASKSLALDAQALLKQIPSFMLTVLIFSIWLSSVLVSRMEAILNWQPRRMSRTFSSEDFSSWKLPDTFVWLALASMAGTFFHVQQEWLRWLATNAFNIVVALYFFQGLAVIVSYFKAKQVSAPWRTLAYILIFSQLFLIVSFVGFVDLWMEFRNKSKTGKSAVA